MQSNVFNPQMLATARNYRGASQTALAADCGMSQSRYSKIENALSVPNADDIERFARALDFPAAFFGLGARALGLPMSFHEMRRSARSVKESDSSRTSADLTLRMMCIEKLLSGVDVEPVLTLPVYEADDHDGDAAEIARMVRRSWMLPSGPLPNLTDLVEKAGIIVFPCQLPAARIDAVAVNIAGLPPVIFLNQTAPADRLRFSLAHELGHVVMHRQMSRTMEDEANAFAAELLMPEREMRREFASGVTMSLLAELKRVRRVSMAALLMRAKTLGCLTKNESDYLWKQFSAKGYKKVEPVTFAPEQASTLRNALALYADELGYSTTDLAAMFGLSCTMTESLFSCGLLKPERRLRLVM